MGGRDQQQGEEGIGEPDPERRQRQTQRRSPGRRHPRPRPAGAAGRRSGRVTANAASRASEAAAAPSPKRDADGVEGEGGIRDQADQGHQVGEQRRGDERDHPAQHPGGSAGSSGLSAARGPGEARRPRRSPPAAAGRAPAGRSPSRGSACRRAARRPPGRARGRRRGRRAPGRATAPPGRRRPGSRSERSAGRSRSPAAAGRPAEVRAIASTPSRISGAWSPSPTGIARRKQARKRSPRWTASAHARARVSIASSALSTSWIEVLCGPDDQGTTSGAGELAAAGARDHDHRLGRLGVQARRRARRAPAAPSLEPSRETNSIVLRVADALERLGQLDQSAGRRPAGDRAVPSGAVARGGDHDPLARIPRGSSRVTLRSELAEALLDDLAALDLRGSGRGRNRPRPRRRRCPACDPAQAAATLGPGRPPGPRRSCPRRRRCAATRAARRPRRAAPRPPRRRGAAPSSVERARLSIGEQGSRNRLRSTLHP